MSDEASRVLEVVNVLGGALDGISAGEQERVAIATRDALESLKPFMYDPGRLPWTATLRGPSLRLRAETWEREF